MNHLKKSADTPLYLQLAQLLRQEMLGGRIRPGDKLASEHQLMQQYGVSRLTVRNAIQQLISEGLIETHHGKGSFCKHTAVEKNIHVLLNMSDHYFVSYYLQSISAVLETCNARLIAGDTRDSNEEIIRQLQEIANKGSDGIIFQGCPKTNPDEAAFSDVLQRLQQKKIPVIAIDYTYPLPQLSCAAMDEVQIGVMAADTLYEKGHRTVAAICVPEDGLSQMRLQGFLRRFPQCTAIHHGESMFRQLRAAMNHGCTALFCYNDLIAQACMEFLKEARISVPDNLSVISVDDTILAYAYGITSVAHAKTKIGTYAAEQILSGEPHHRIFSPTLVERRSVRAL